MLATHLDAERRYNDLRQVAYETAQTGAVHGVRFMAITADALRTASARQIRIMHPINDDVTRYYESFGYRYIASGDYLFREVP